MKTSFELKSDENKAKSTLGYGIMWLFICVLVGVLPFYTGSDFSIFYIAGGISLLAGSYKIIKGIQQLSSL